MSDQNSDKDQGDATLEDILKSIRGVIDNHDEQIQSTRSTSADSMEFVSDEDNILELDNIVLEGNNSVYDDKEMLISSSAQHKTKSEINKLNDYLENKESNQKDESLDTVISNLMLPLLKNWLDNNLPEIVEKVVREEIRKIVKQK